MKKMALPEMEFIRLPDTDVIVCSGCGWYDCQRERGSTCDAVCYEYDGHDCMKVSKDFVE